VRTIPVAVQSAINTRAFAECTLWTITRRDAVVFRFTDWDRDLTYDGNVYGSAISYTKSADASMAGLAPANADINGILDSSAITEADLIAGLWDYAEVEVSRVNPFLLSDGPYATTRTHIGQVSTDSPSFTAELLGLAKALDKNVGRVITATCPVTLGDSECTKDLTAFTFTGTLDAVDASGLVLTDAVRTEATDYFKFGKITMTSGLSNGYSMDIKASTSAGVITLFLPLPFGVTAGDNYSIVAGCDKLKATCKDKFANLDNFRGFPDAPTQEKVVNHA
jgi:uncharacterized phage protein (TIGR02218 family)